MTPRANHNDRPDGPLARSVIVRGAFDDLRSRHLRFLEEAARLGPVTVVLTSDAGVQQRTGQAPKFPFAERCYLLEAVRYVTRVVAEDPALGPDALPELPEWSKGQATVWVDGVCRTNDRRQAFCRQRGIEYQVLEAPQLEGFPAPTPRAPTPGAKKVVVTGCYDWLHSGHVRFFEEVSAYGDLYVIVGHDANIRLLKGEGHPLLPQAERCYVVGSIRQVTQALISTGEGWLDADPEITRLRPDIYAVNDDGDRGGKREYCARRGLEYLVLRRTPAPGLAHRSSTALRGF